MLTQTGDPTNTGSGGETAYGEPLPDEFSSRLTYLHRGILGMVPMQEGAKNSCKSQFFVTLGACPEFNGKRPMFGRIVGKAIHTLSEFDSLELEDQRAGNPVRPPIILRTDVIVNPFEGMVKRSKAKKDVKESQAESKSSDSSKSKVRAGGSTLNKSLLSFAGEEGEDEEIPLPRKSKSHVPPTQLLLNQDAHEEEIPRPSPHFETLSTQHEPRDSSGVESTSRSEHKSSSDRRASERSRDSDDRVDRSHASNSKRESSDSSWRSDRHEGPRQRDRDRDRDRDHEDSHSKLERGQALLEERRRRYMQGNLGESGLKRKYEEFLENLSSAPVALHPSEKVTRLSEGKVEENVEEDDEDEASILAKLRAHKYVKTRTKEDEELFSNQAFERNYSFEDPLEKQQNQKTWSQSSKWERRK